MKECIVGGGYISGGVAVGEEVLVDMRTSTYLLPKEKVDLFLFECIYNILTYIDS